MPAVAARRQLAQGDAKNSRKVLTAIMRTAPFNMFSLWEQSSRVWEGCASRT
jgi:hypothetical protein